MVRKTINKTRIFLLFSVVFVTIELILRFYFGFADAVLCLKSDKYEYIYAPNQERFRFRKNIKYNAFSMRSGAVDPVKTKVLGLGDSVLNGGAVIDQKDLATSIVSEDLNIQVLNISAGSWGPDNNAAYLKEKGLFAAKAIVLVVSSHDAYDNMDFMDVVDKHPSYPSKQYKLAIWELVGRYLLPRFLNVVGKTAADPDQAVALGIQKNGTVFNPGFEQLKNIANKANIPFYIYLHPEKTEVQNKKYNAQGIEIIRWAKQNDIDIVQGVLTETIAGFRDGIHLNVSGQQNLAHSLEQILQNLQ